MLIDEYFEYQLNFEKKYGTETLVLMQVGSFFEFYGVDNNQEKIGNLQFITELLNIQLTRRNKAILENSRSNCLMGGFPTHALKRFLPLLLNNNYTIILIEQTTEPPNPKREITQIFSPGTYIEEINKSDPNFIVSIYLTEHDCYKTGSSVFMVGLSAIDLSTGQNIIYQGSVNSYDKNALLEDIYRFIESNNPKEILFYSNELSKVSTNEIRQTLNSMNRIVHLHFSDIEKKFFQLSYQNAFLGKIFPNHGLLSPIEFLDFERKYEALVSYLLLLQFSYEHNERIIEKIQKPTIWEYHDHLILYHNTIYQLNIISTDSYKEANNKCKYKCLYDIINKTSTSLGKRLLKYRIMNPITNTDILNNRYLKIENMISSGKIYEIENILNEIVDIERLHRKISLQMLHPYEFLNLSYSYDNILKLFEYFVSDIQLMSLYDIKQQTIDDFNLYIKYYKYVFDLMEMGKYGLLNITNSFLKKGIYLEIDSIQDEIEKINDFFNKECNYLSNIIEKDSDFVKVDNNDREGYFYYCTKKRADILMEKLNASDKKKYEIRKFNGSNIKIVSKEIMEKSDKIIANKDNIQKIVKDKYLEILLNIENKFRLVLDEISKFVAEFDFVKSGAKCAILYNYCKPEIINKYDNKSYFSSKKIRHPIIEVINQEKSYVENDVELLKKDIKNEKEQKEQKEEDYCSGILLYGVNGVGKSSLGKAIGTNIILAQMGYYTASSNFIFYPYHKIFTRINGDDNIFKGMSSFVVEMSELKSILKYADSQSIVIGDEVCKGTEETSALAIVSSSIVHFSKNNVNFILATHFHKLYDLSCIKNLKNIKLYHLSVNYDSKNDIIIYGRKLEHGSGSDLYGLEIANYIIKDDNFMAFAKNIRNEVLNLQTEIVSTQTSNYNKDLYVDKCMICGDNGLTYPLDTHHIVEQKIFDKNNNTESFHKNKLANLVVLCKTHHDSVHHGNLTINGYKDTTNGLLLDYNDKNNKIQKDQEDQEQIDKQKETKGKTNKKYNNTQIEIIKNIANKLKEQKQSMIIIQNELKKQGMQISPKTIKNILNNSY
jgi:DNA mismatch repair protein MutS